MADEHFSIERFESLIARRSYEVAAQEMLRLLADLDRHHGWLIDQGTAGPRPDNDALLSRIVAGVSALFSDPGFHFTEQGFRRFVHFHRWIGALFGASTFRTSDHIIRALSTAPPDAKDTLRIEDKDLYKLALLYSLDSSIPLQPDALWQKNKELAATMFFGLLSSRCVISDAAHQKREMLLEWLPQRLDDVDLERLPGSYMHDVWMHCSYATSPRKHDIKKAINRLIRRWVASSDLSGFERTAPPPPRHDRPRLVVVVDWFHSRHVVYTVFSRILAPLREKFRVSCLSLGTGVDETAAALFDEVIEHRLGTDEPMAVQLARIMKLIGEREPDILFYLGVGMSLTGIFLANTRLAPVQIASHAHPSSTQTETIDYFVLEEYYERAASDFTERRVFLPPDALFLAPPSDLESVPLFKRDTPTVNIAVVATVMKLNPVFLRACQIIRARSHTPVRFHFLVGYVGGVASVYASNQIRQFLPDAVIHGQMGRPDYLKTIAACDMFIDPFPFGNANTMVDCLSRGLPGVTLRCDQIFGHMGAVTMQRMGLGTSLIADSIEKYVELAIQVANDPALRNDVRNQLRSILVPGHLEDIHLFKGNTGVLSQTLYLLHERGKKESRTFDEREGELREREG